jgi:hypothetical protein
LIQLSQKLKDLYVLLLHGGQRLGWSETTTFEVALSTNIKFLTLFYFRAFLDIGNIEAVFKQWIRSSNKIIQGIKISDVEKIFPHLILLSSDEMRLIESISEEDWQVQIIQINKHHFTIIENFQRPTDKDERITPEFLSILAEMVVNEFEQDFSLTPKVSSRKVKGAYYSPWKIIRELTNRLLGRDNISARVLDPSCGTGSFLVYAAERIFRNQLKIEKKLVVRASTIIQNSIFGVDKSSLGILVTKLRLLFWLLENDPRFQIGNEDLIFSNIREGNSLFGYIGGKIDAKSTKNLNRDYIQYLLSFSEKPADKKFLKRLDSSHINFFHWIIEYQDVISEGGFDICLGNPPYGRSVLLPDEKKILKIAYKSCKGNIAKRVSLNSASAFIERSISLLKPEGRMAFILPFSILRVEEFEGIRDFILENMIIDEIHDESAAFQDVTLEMCSLILTKGLKSDYVIPIKPRDGLKPNPPINKQVFKQYKRYMIYYDEKWQKIVQNGRFSQIMGDYGIDHRIIKKDLKVNFSPSEDYIVPFLHSGKSVLRYALNPHFFHWSKANHSNERFNKYLHNPKLICTAIGNEFRIAYKPKGIIPGTNVSIMEVTNPNQDFFPLMIILNSSLINYLLKRYILNYSHLTVYLHKYYTKWIPIKYPQSNEKQWIILGQYISFLTQLKSLNVGLSYDSELKFLRRMVEHMVYQLYLPELFTNVEGDLHEILNSLLQKIEFTLTQETLLSPAQNIREIINQNHSKIMRTEAKIHSVLEAIKSTPLPSLIQQTEKIRHTHLLTKDIFLDNTPKMIQT